MTSSKTKNPILLNIVIFIAIIVAGYFLLNKKVERRDSYKIKENKTINSSSSPDNIPKDAPEYDTLYFGEYQNKPVIFYKSRENNSQSNAYDGQAITLTAGLNPLDYRKIINLKKIGLYASIVGFNNIKLNNRDDILYISFNSGVYPNNLYNEVIKVDLKKPDIFRGIEKPWTNHIGYSRYSANGAAYIDSVLEYKNTDRYIVLSIINCYAC